MRIPLIATFCLLAVAVPLLADGNAKITEVNLGQFAIALGPNDSERLDAYLELKLRDPKRLPGEVEHDLQQTKDASGQLFEWDFKHNYYSVVFAATRAGAADREVVRFVLHDDGHGVVVVDHLPGVTTFYEVFLSPDPDAAIATVFSSKAEPNPLQEKALKAVKQIEGPFATVVDKLLARNPTAVVPSTVPAAVAAASSVPQPGATDDQIIALLRNDAAIPPVYVLLRRVETDDPRSTVSVTTSIADDAEFQRLVLLGRVDRTALQLSQSVAAFSICANTMTTNIVNEARFLLLHPAKLSLIVPAGERKAIATDLREGTISTTIVSCASELKNEPDRAARMTAIATVQDRMLGIFTGSSDPVETSESFSNVPLQHFDLGAAAGAMVRKRGAVRAKVNDAGEAVDDPLSGVLMMAALHWHPVPFDAKTAKPTSAERFSVLAGFVVQPEPGLAAGLSWSLFRGLNVHVSHAWLLVDRKNPDAPDSLPLRNGWARTWVVGFGYNFE